MWVIKIGGSLQNSSYLTKWLDVIQTYGRGKVVIVAGGGKFADTVRESQQILGFDDKSAHLMALLAMEQSAYLLKGLMPELQLAGSIQSLRNCLENKGVPIWLPYRLIAGETGIPASWDVTSDSLAVWLANKMQINSLILVKSVALPEHYKSYADLADRGLIDPCLGGLLENSDIQMTWMHKNEPDLLATILGNEPQSDFRMPPCPLSGYENPDLTLNPIRD